MTSVALSRGLELRDATPDDNGALIALAGACTMDGDMGLRVDRAPDFFALNRLEGEASRVGVVTDDGEIVGCVAFTRRRAFYQGRETAIGYASDLKVHSRARGLGAADLLSEYAREASRELTGDAPVILTILGGNRRMENRARGPRGTPVLERFASLDVMAIPLLWKRRVRSALRIRSAQLSDVEQMCDVWQRFARTRQFAASWDSSSLAEWIDAAPGLDISDYLLAFDSRGSIAGFLGVWDQASFKQLRVVSYSRRMAWARRGINAVAPCVGTARLPRAGGELLSLATVHVCAEHPAVLRSLLLEAYRRYRDSRYACITIGLDTRDSLIAATRGWMAQPTRVNAYASVAPGTNVADFAALPMHFETALV
jgi:ribosomal protein S18 acetylase RimI-like enzyme